MTMIGSRVKFLRSKLLWNLPSKGWLEGFEVTKSLYIHIPKTAGTSICDALYERDPWHYSLNHYKNIRPHFYNSLFKFAFVRDPYDRLLSTYNYSFIQKKNHPTTSVAFITEYDSFEDFVNEWVTRENVSSHYFLKCQSDYVFESNGETSLDYLGRFETLHEDFHFVCQRIGKTIDLPHKNASSHPKAKFIWTDAIKQKVYNAYEPDFENFGYAR